ncbi:uncharacterized protein LOC126555902 isoform X2 [Aphis gossypii]|uniref:uncharacterized protein LOC126555902 isoform X2 n=1 Tax=Aphis gossypii TaxID=80765 RepID=UPI0021590AC9|nr:uncharacterized protein LOC126555902 isoform X2 [Aphis gossypii]
MSRSKKLLALALAKDSPSFHANEELLKLQNNTIHQKTANNSNKNFRNVNTDVFSSKDLPLQFPYQNTKNENKIEKSYDLRPIPNTLSAHVIHDPGDEILSNNSSSSVFDDSDADQTYNPFYIKQKTTEVCSNNSPDCIEASIDLFDSLSKSNEVLTELSQNLDSTKNIQAEVNKNACRKLSYITNEDCVKRSFDEVSCSYSLDTIKFTNQPSTSNQVAGIIENNSNSLLLQSNEPTANNQNIIHDNGDEIGHVVCSKNKRYKKGKRNFMSNCKYLGQEYEDRNGKQKPKKVFRTIKFCCKKNCFNLCPEDIQKLIFEEFYGLGNLGAQDQTLMDGIQIEEKKRATTFIRKSAPRTTHNRLVTVIYNLQVNGKMLNVCKKMFQNVYGIGRGRLDVIINKKKKSITGISPKSGKGKSQNFQQEERVKILNHIQSFPAFESHYSRKNTSRLYLSQNLNIQKMFDLYKEQCSENGESYSSNWLYRSVFAETGLKFKLPSVDTC